MPKWRVGVTQSYYRTGDIVVEAPSLVEAQNLAQEQLDRGDIPAYTIPWNEYCPDGDIEVDNDIIGDEEEYLIEERKDANTP